MKFNLTAILASMIFLTACATATVGRDFKDQNLPQIQPGKTTLSDAVALLGTAPMSSVIGKSGAWGYTWTYIEANANTLSGNTTSNHKNVTLIFSTDGTFQRIFSMGGFDMAETDRKRLTNVPVNAAEGSQ